MKAKHITRLFETCSINQPVYEPLQRIPASLRQTSLVLLQRKKKESKNLSPIFNLLVEIGDLIHKLERRLYCFMTELQRTKTDSAKYKSLWTLYDRIKPNMINIMEISTYLGEEQGDEQQVSDEFLWNSYLRLLRELRPIGDALLQYLSVKQNMETLNYKYQYERGTLVPTCFSTSYPEVTEMMRQGRPNSEINQKKYALISKCLEKKKISPQCVQLYDTSVASGSRDVFIMQAFMRIQLLLHSLQKERRKYTVVKAIEQKIQKQESQIDNQVFGKLKALTEGSNVILPRQRIVLQNRKCITKQQKQQKQKQQQKQLNFM